MPAKPAKSPKPKPLATLALPPAWEAVSSIITDGGRVIAGSTGRVAAFGADATLTWETVLESKAITTLTVGGDLIAAQADDSATVFLLDRATGELRATHRATGSWVRTIAITPDGARAVVRVGNETVVYALPAFTAIKTLEEYVNESPIACSSTHLAVAGHEIHIYDATTLAHVATVEPADSPFCLAWTSDGKLVGAGNGGMVTIFEPDGTVIAELDSTPEKKAKKTSRSLAATATHIAVTRSDDVVIVLARETRAEVARFSKFPDAPVAFADDGSLWIGAARYAIG